MSLQHTTAGWAHALTAALSQAVADPTLLDAGRHLTRTGAPGALNVNQGFATAKFPLPDGRVCRPRLLVTELTAAQWDRVETAIGARPDAVDVAGTTAISDQLTDPVHTAGIPLVPTAQDISHACRCTAGTPAVACVHTVAVGYLLIERIRTAPAALFTLRGRPHQHLKRRLRALHGPSHPHREAPAPIPPPTAPAAPAARPAGTSTHMIPAQLTEPPAPLPEPVDLGLGNIRPVLTGALTSPPPPMPDLNALQLLAEDAAHRAGRLLEEDETPVYPDAGSDLARLVALPHGASYWQLAMDRLGLNTVAMGHLQLAHTYGGPGGAAAYLEPFTVDHDVLAHAQDVIQPLRPAPTATVECEHNRLTDHAAGVQLRYGPDGRWHPYRCPYGTWQPVPGVADHPADAYRAARAATRSPRGKR